jgi:hypothetical protein
MGALGAKVGDATSDPTLMTFADGGAAGAKTETVFKNGNPTTRTLYPFEIKGTIPTETPLIVKTSSSTTSAGWLELYEYNLIARNDGLTNGAYVQDVRAVGDDDYAAIMQAAYARPVEGGKSAIAGEVHDCGDVRLSNATVGIAPNDGLGLFYLTDDQDNPLPSGGLRSTLKLGLYGAGGLQPGTYTVSALGNTTVNGKTTTIALGTGVVQTFPNAVTVYTFRGLRPWDVQK